MSVRMHMTKIHAEGGIERSKEVVSIERRSVEDEGRRREESNSKQKRRRR